MGYKSTPRPSSRQSRAAKFRAAHTEGTALPRKNWVKKSTAPDPKWKPAEGHHAAPYPGPNNRKQTLGRMKFTEQIEKIQSIPCYDKRTGVFIGFKYVNHDRLATPTLY